MKHRALPAVRRTSRKRFAIVVSLFNERYTRTLVRAALETLSGHETEVIEVPGAFELPLQVQRLARRGTFDAVLAFGLIWQGKTLHATEILRAVTDALMRTGLETDTPVIHQVLCVRNEKEAQERTSGRFNRGREGAEVALAVAGLSR
jgi:6,7-dimethyl-8-ribityllumazine synthase